MFDIAAHGSPSPLFIAVAGLAGMGLGILAGLFTRRVLPLLSGTSSRRPGITTATVTFALSALLAGRFGASAELPAYVLLAVIGTQLVRIDLQDHLLPNRLVLALLCGGLLLLACAAVVQGEAGSLLRGLAGASTLFLVYLLLALTSRNGLGMGDVKLAAPLGLYLGHLGWSQLFYGGALGFVAGGLAALGVMLKNRGNKPQEIAYGPSMLAAALGIVLLMP